MSLPAHISDGLRDVARRFGDADVEYAVGGSVMLHLRGIDIAVGDIDVVVRAGARREVADALAGLRVEDPTSREPWRTDWFLRAWLETAGGEVALDVMGGLALMIEGSLVRFPHVVEMSVPGNGVDIPLAPLAHWYHIYQIHNPARAALIRPHLDDAAIARAAAELSIR